MSATTLSSLLTALSEDEGSFPEKLGEEFGCETNYAAYGLLKFLSDEERSRPQWQRMSEIGAREPKKYRDRDETILRLWQWVERIPDFIDSKFVSTVYHRHWFFEWFLGRYDLRKARTIWRTGWWIANAQVILLVAVGAIATAELSGLLGGGLSGPLLARPTSVALAIAYLMLTWGLAAAFRAATAGTLEAVIVVLHSLVPRLAAASAAAIVILGSSRDLLRFVIEGASWWRFAVLVGASVGYLLLEMGRRIHPVPRLRRLLLHGFDVSVTAFAHALALSLLAAPALRSLMGRQSPYDAVELLNVAALLFALGVVVNLIWAEEPVTQPL